jgi:primase-polymerase (primpol)-like protein
MQMNDTKNWLKPEFENIPEELEAQPWAVWTAEPRPNNPNKFNKAPRSPVTGYKIGANKPELFGTFQEAKTAYASGKYTGIGVLLTGNGIIGVDIDDAKETFADKPEIKEWVATAANAGAHSEKSPSGKGIRLFMLGKLPAKGRKVGHLEIYDDARFLTVTGHIYPRKKGGA